VNYMAIISSYHGIYYKGSTPAYFLTPTRILTGHHGCCVSALFHSGGFKIDRMTAPSVLSPLNWISATKSHGRTWDEVQP